MPAACLGCGRHRDLAKDGHCFDCLPPPFTAPEQPAPAPNHHPAVWDTVMRMMVARDALGQQRYKVRLQPLNGRDALRDLTEELLDGVAYSVQLRVELTGLGTVLRALHAAMTDGATMEEAAGMLGHVLGQYPVLAPAP